MNSFTHIEKYYKDLHEVEAEFEKVLLEIQQLRYSIDSFKTEKLNNEKLYTLKDFSEKTGVSYRKIRLMCVKREIPFIKAGSKYLLNYRDVIEALTIKDKYNYIFDNK